MTTIEASWRARWKAAAYYYRTLYFHPVTADCPQAGQRAQVTNFCANCETTERRNVELQAERDTAQADAAALRRFLIASIRQLGDPAFLITYQSGKQLVAEVRRAMTAQLETENPGAPLLAELAAARTQFATLHAAVQQVIFTLNSRDEDAAALERALTALEQVADLNKESN